MEKRNDDARHGIASILRKAGIQRRNTESPVRVIQRGTAYRMRSEKIKRIPVQPESENMRQSMAISFVDGGQGNLIESPDLCVSFIRIAVLTRKNGRSREKTSEFYAVTQAERKNERKIFRSRLISASDGIDIEKYFARIENESEIPVEAEGRRREAPEAASKVRRIAEIYAAAETAGNTSGKALIVIDGHLESEDEGEEKALRNLWREADEKEAVIAALAKRTTMLSENGNSIAAIAKVLAEKKGETGAWILPLEPESNSNTAEENKENKRKEKSNGRTETFFVKLHPQSRFVFKLQRMKGQGLKAEEIAEILAGESKDPVFPGYPYGLIRADRTVRVSNRELEYEKIRLQTALGKEWGSIEGSMILPDAHKVLDSIY